MRLLLVEDNVPLADELVSDALRTFLERNDLQGSQVAISVPGQAGLVKFIKLPPVEKKRIPDIVKFEAMQQIPFPIDDVEWDYQTFANPDMPDVEVVLGVVRAVLRHLPLLRHRASEPVRPRGRHLPARHDHRRHQPSPPR